MIPEDNWGTKLFELNFETWLEKTSSEHPFCSHLYKKAMVLKPKTIVDLGIFTAFSTTIFLTVVDKFGGKVWSVDKEKYPEGFERLERLPFVNLKNWSCSIMDDLEWAKNWNSPIDLLFIDTSHEYSHTLKELEKFSSFVVQDGIIFMHDTHKIGVNNAIMDFIRNNTEWEFEELLPNDRCGLGKLVRRK